MIKLEQYRDIWLSEKFEEVIVEDSPKDSFLGLGNDRNGKNMLGSLWMKLREEYKNK